MGCGVIGKRKKQGENRRGIGSSRVISLIDISGDLDEVRRHTTSSYRHTPALYTKVNQHF